MQLEKIISGWQNNHFHYLSEKNNIMKSGLIRGLALIGVGAFIIYWAITHSPKAGALKVISNEIAGSYTMGEGAYYASLIAGIILVVLGLMRSYKSMK